MIVNAIDQYRWEIAGCFIVIFVGGIFFSTFSLSFIYLLLGYFWCWTLASPKLVYKTRLKRYKLSMLRWIVLLEGSVRQLPQLQKRKDQSYHRVLSRLLSLSLFAVFMSALISWNIFSHFLLGGLAYEVILLIKLQR